jgi:hypothetical protein
MPADPVLKFKGTKAMKRKIEALADGFGDKVKQALRIEAEGIVTHAKQRFVPTNLSSLKGSGHVQPARRKGKTITVVMGFGNQSAPYALAIHEHPSPASPRSWKGKDIGDIKSVRKRQPWDGEGGGKGPKYLERPMNLATKGMVARIAKMVGV